MLYESPFKFSPVSVSCNLSIQLQSENFTPSKPHLGEGCPLWQRRGMQPAPATLPLGGEGGREGGIEGGMDGWREESCGCRMLCSSPICPCPTLGALPAWPGRGTRAILLTSASAQSFMLCRTASGPVPSRCRLQCWCSLRSGAGRTCSDLKWGDSGWMQRRANLPRWNSAPLWGGGFGVCSFHHVGIWQLSKVMSFFFSPSWEIVYSPKLHLRTS